MLSALVSFALAQVLLHTLPVSGAVVAQPLTLTTSNLTISNSTLGVPRVDPDRCVNQPDWIGGGILDSDCQAALNELWWDDVNARPANQKYEFLRHGVRRVSYNPSVLTPRKHFYGESILM